MPPLSFGVGIWRRAEFIDCEKGHLGDSASLADREASHIGARMCPPSVQLYTVLNFEWDRKKEASNVRKHGIRFVDAVHEP
jgi:hypothetical protein